MEEEEHPEIPIRSCTFIPAKNMQFRVGGHKWFAFSDSHRFLVSMAAKELLGVN